jgi:hypothetical protein
VSWLVLLCGGGGAVVGLALRPLLAIAPPQRVWPPLMVVPWPHQGRVCCRAKARIRTSQPTGETTPKRRTGRPFQHSFITRTKKVKDPQRDASLRAKRSLAGPR